MDEWVELNRSMWDERADVHAGSVDYAVEQFVSDRSFLSQVVRFDLPRLGSITGLRAVHLQCHIGTDTLSLHRLGAQVTGLDFSEPAILQARDLARRAGAQIEYVHAAVDDAPQVLPGEAFDLVYTGIGALCWLPDIQRWAQIVAGLLRPGGRLFVREGHPMLWSIDETHEDVLAVGYPYFGQSQPLVLDEPGTYVATDHVFTHTRAASWNHGLGEVVTALLAAGLTITMLLEHDSVPWEALPDRMELLPGGEYRLRDHPERLPHTYTLQAVKLS